MITISPTPIAFTSGIDRKRSEPEDQHRQRLAAPGQERRGDHIVEREANAQEPRDHQRGQQKRESDPPEHTPGACSEVGRHILETVVIVASRACTITIA